MPPDTDPAPPSKNWLPVISLAAGAYALFRGWSRGWPWFVALGIGFLFVAALLFCVQRSERLRKWEPRIILAVLVVIVVVFLVVCGLDISRSM
jgi:peptidoglycan/LPS O-acetylase OafA/YrhL